MADQYNSNFTGPEIDAILGNAVRYDLAQSLTTAQQTQARGNIGAANDSYTDSHKQNGTLVQMSFDTKGWYRIVTGTKRSGGILTVQHSYNNGGPSSLKLLVTLSEEGSSLKCIEYTNYMGSAITNARIVSDASGRYCIDVYYSVDGTNAGAIDFISTGREEAKAQAPVYIGASDALPNGETLKATMEYLNPPLALGVEYRTTERYLGKPVYVKAVDCGLAADGKEVEHGIAGISNCISAQGISSVALPQMMDHNLSNAWSVYISQFTPNLIRIECGTNIAANITVILKYTKNTD